MLSPIDFFALTNLFIPNQSLLRIILRGTDFEYCLILVSLDWLSYLYWVLITVGLEPRICDSQVDLLADIANIIQSDLDWLGNNWLGLLETSGVVI